jgi:CBS domain-containing protein
MNLSDATDLFLSHKRRRFPVEEGKLVGFISRKTLRAALS